jgi:hypothetical protein
MLMTHTLDGYRETASPQEVAGPLGEQPGDRAGQALGRPPGLHEQAAAGRPALDPPAETPAPPDDHLSVTHAAKTIPAWPWPWSGWK